MKSEKNISSRTGKDSASKANANNLPKTDIGTDPLLLKKDGPEERGLPDSHTIREMASDNPQVNQLKAYQQMADDSSGNHPVIQQKEEPAANNTGIPDNLKTGVEQLGGQSLDDVKVHYNSSEPAQLNALAYAQGTDIHIGPGQEKHLPHEAWHVVQQKQGRVQPTNHQAGKNINDDVSLEKEADSMGTQATQFKPKPGSLESGMEHTQHNDLSEVITRYSPPVQKFSSNTTQSAGFRVNQWKSNPSSAVVQKADADGLIKPGEVAQIDAWIVNQLDNVQGYKDPIYALGSYGRKEVNVKSDLDIYIEDPDPAVLGTAETAFKADAGIQAIFNGQPSGIEPEDPAKVDLGVFRKLTGGGGAHSKKVAAARAKYAAGAGGPVFQGLAGGISFDDLISGLKEAVKDPDEAIRQANGKIIKELVYKKLYAYVQGIALTFGVSQDITNSIDRIADVKVQATAAAAAAGAGPPPMDLLQPMEDVFNRTLILRTKDLRNFTAADKKEVTTGPFKDVLRSVLDNSANYTPATKNQLLRTVPAPGGCCFITTACVQARGLPDDCEELKTLRAYRDNYLLKLKSGPEIIQAYYQFSPGIVTAIDNRKNAGIIYDGIYKVLRTCIKCIRRREDEMAFYFYGALVMALKDEFTPEVVLPDSITCIFN